MRSRVRSRARRCCNWPSSSTTSRTSWPGSRIATADIDWVNRAFLINYTIDHGGERTSLDSRDVLGKTDYDLSPAFLADQFRLDDE